MSVCFLLLCLTFKERVCQIKFGFSLVFFCNLFYQVSCWLPIYMQTTICWCGVQFLLHFLGMLLITSCVVATSRYWRCTWKQSFCPLPLIFIFWDRVSLFAPPPPLLPPTSFGTPTPHLWFPGTCCINLAGFEISVTPASVKVCATMPNLRK